MRTLRPAAVRRTVSALGLPALILALLAGCDGAEKGFPPPDESIKSTRPGANPPGKGAGKVTPPKSTK